MHTSTTLTTAALGHHLDAAIQHLRSLNHHAFLQYAIAVGQYLVDHFFGGDFAAVHDQDPGKQNSFQELLARRGNELKELNLSGSTLRRYMAATEVWHGLPERTRTELGLDQLQRLAAIPDAAERRRLAHDAATMHWTREQVATAVREYKQAQRHGKRKPGPKQKPVVLKAAAAARSAVHRLVQLHGASARLADDHRSELDAEIAAIRQALQSLG